MGDLYGKNVRAVSWDTLDGIATTIAPSPALREREQYHLATANRAPALPPERIWEAVARVRSIPRDTVPEVISTLSLEETIALDRDIVASWITYADVDKQPFWDQYGRGLSLGQYLELGMGDCSQYTYAFVVVFDAFRAHNPRLRDVVVVDGNDLGGDTTLHAWNAIAVPTRDALLIAHVDVQAHDTGDVFAGQADLHYPSDPLEFSANVYAKLSERKRAFSYRVERVHELKELFRASRRVAATGDQAAYDTTLNHFTHLSIVLEDMGSDAYDDRDLSGLRWARDEAVKLSLTLPGVDRLTYYMALVEKEQGYPQTAAAMRKILYDRFPDSLWTAKLTE